MKAQKKFIKHVGKCALAGKSVVAYEESDGRVRVSAETIGGKPVLYGFLDRDGERHTVAVRDRVMSRAEFEKFEDSLSAGIVGTQDVRIVQRALIELGYPADSFE